MVWGKSRNVTDNSPTRLGALRVALSYPKHDGVSWVWLTIVILVKVKCTLRGHILWFWAVWGDLGLGHYASNYMYAATMLTITKEARSTEVY